MHKTFERGPSLNDTPMATLALMIIHRLSIDVEDIIKVGIPYKTQSQTTLANLQIL